MDYIVVMDNHGHDVIYETSNITDIQLLQPLNVGRNEPYYLVLISYNNRERENIYLSDSQWKRWNERKNNENK